MIETIAAEHRALIQHYLELHRYEQALELVNEALSVEPENGELHIQAAFSLYHLEEYQKAEEHAKHAFQNGYPSHQIYYLLGHIYRDQEKWQDAEHAYLEALSETPNDASILSSYSSLLLRLGEWEKGIHLMEVATALDPNDPTVLHHHLYLGIARNNNHSRMMHLEKYIQHEDNHTNTLLHLGSHEFYNANYRAAKKLFQEAFIKNPTDHRLMLFLRELEFMTNPIMFPIMLSHKIGGLPFFAFWLALISLCFYPTTPQIAIWSMFSFFAILVYAFIASHIVNLHQTVLDSPDPYVKALFSPDRIISFIGITLACLTLYLTHHPFLAIGLYLCTKVIWKRWKKKRSNEHE